MFLVAQRVGQGGGAGAEWFGGQVKPPLSGVTCQFVSIECEPLLGALFRRCLEAVECAGLVGFDVKRKSCSVEMFLYVWVVEWCFVVLDESLFPGPFFRVCGGALEKKVGALCVVVHCWCATSARPVRRVVFCVVGVV